MRCRNGGYSTSPLLGMFCGRGNESRVLLSHSNNLYLRFRTDQSNNEFRGFELYYDGTATGTAIDRYSMGLSF